MSGRWCYLYRAVDRDGNLLDSMLSQHMAKKQSWAEMDKSNTPFEKLREAYATYNRTTNKSPRSLIQRVFTRFTCLPHLTKF